MATDVHKTCWTYLASLLSPYFLFRNGCFALCVGGCLWLWTLTFRAARDKISIHYPKSRISNKRWEDELYLVKSSPRRSVLTSRAPKTSSRIWIKSLLSSVKVWGSGSRPLSVRNFNKTVKIKTERWGGGKGQLLKWIMTSWKESEQLDYTRKKILQPFSHWT